MRLDHKRFLQIASRQNNDELVSSLNDTGFRQRLRRDFCPLREIGQGDALQVNWRKANAPGIDEVLTAFFRAALPQRRLTAFKARAYTATTTSILAFCTAPGRLAISRTASTSHSLTSMFRTFSRF